MNCPHIQSVQNFRMQGNKQDKTVQKPDISDVGSAATWC